MLVGMLNKFGEGQGFEKILDVIKDPETNIELVHYLVSCVEKCNGLFHKSFVDNYLPRLSSAVEQKLLNATGAQLRQVKKERIDEIVTMLWQEIMSRVVPSF